MTHQHEWVVFSTALADCCLMVQCVDCCEMGTIDDPSEKEWSEAYYAPSRPYRWVDESRIRPLGVAPLHVVRAEKKARRCDCPFSQADLAYERFPAEIMSPDPALTQDERRDLKE